MTSTIFDRIADGRTDLVFECLARNDRATHPSGCTGGGGTVKASATL